MTIKKDLLLPEKGKPPNRNTTKMILQQWLNILKVDWNSIEQLVICATCLKLKYKQQGKRFALATTAGGPCHEQQDHF